MLLGACFFVLAHVCHSQNLSDPVYLEAAVSYARGPIKGTFVLSDNTLINVTETSFVVLPYKRPSVQFLFNKSTLTMRTAGMNDMNLTLMSPTQIVAGNSTFNHTFDVQVPVSLIPKPTGSTTQSGRRLQQLLPGLGIFGWGLNVVINADLPSEAQINRATQNLCYGVFNATNLLCNLDDVIGGGSEFCSAGLYSPRVDTRELAREILGIGNLVKLIPAVGFLEVAANTVCGFKAAAQLSNPESIQCENLA